LFLIITPDIATEKALGKSINSVDPIEYYYWIPIGRQTVDAALKALVHEWKSQRDDGRNYTDSPRQSKNIENKVKAYGRRLVMEKISPSLDRGAFCPLRDGYTIQEFLALMSKLWKGDYPNAWHSRLTYIRDRAAINLRHQMLLRDEDLRHLDLADCFSECINTPLFGTTEPIHGLAFCLSRGKTQKEFQKNYSIVLRHKNFLRCGVGAFGFYLFERFHVSP
jgi:hypothetical protein